VSQEQSSCRRGRVTGPAPTCTGRHRGTPAAAASAPRSTSPLPTITSCRGRRRAAGTAMPSSSSFLGAYPSSSASSPLSYLIQTRPPPPLLKVYIYALEHTVTSCNDADELTDASFVQCVLLRACPCLRDRDTVSSTMALAACLLRLPSRTRS
jgi:hypothetical protein